MRLKIGHLRRQLSHVEITIIIRCRLVRSPIGPARLLDHPLNGFATSIRRNPQPTVAGFGAAGWGFHIEAGVGQVGE
jgi:hypothetical protein